MAVNTPLLSDPEAASVSNNDDWDSPESKSIHAHARSRSLLGGSTKRTDHLVLLACLTSVASLFLNITRFHLHANSPSTARGKLGYPNPYIGLERAILKDTTPPAPIVNFPLVLAQINSSEPGTIYLQQPHSPTFFGMIYPEDRDFLVTNQVSTIVQFRSLDFQMEQCIAMLVTPSPTDEQKFPNKNVSSSIEPFPLEIYSLREAVDLDPYALSWSTRPARGEILTTLGFLPGQENVLESPAFDCPARTLITLEIHCATPNCHLRFRQDKKAPRLAFFITQYSSAPRAIHIPEHPVSTIAS
ncbi:hypothetical protein C8R43DRAFT_1124367 [Mycena crocata]|nr:hypothetical protein C8R43DRAFT_1124367 [Mycena crocata]